MSYAQDKARGFRSSDSEILRWETEKPNASESLRTVLVAAAILTLVALLAIARGPVEAPADADARSSEAAAQTEAPTSAIKVYDGRGKWGGYAD